MTQPLGVARVTQGNAAIYIGTNQVTAINQDPIVAKFTNGTQDWCITDIETTGADGRGMGLYWSGANLYGVFSTDGTQGTTSEDYRHFTTAGWLEHYTDASPMGGGGAKVSIILKLDPATGLASSGTFITALNSDNKTNSLTVKNLYLQSGQLVVRANSWFSPRNVDKTAMVNSTAGASPHDYTIIFDPTLATASTAFATGWISKTPAPSGMMPIAASIDLVGQTKGVFFARPLLVD